ncbi:MAG: hypothetical protein PHR81_12620 [Bacteroidales bacterium]|jgi:hypothetical protein|nr:hypothetical protein [Bacteroidales bacterium]MDD4215646.1 hypothetical protein [Bacteroidales bacterium]
MKIKILSILAILIPFCCLSQENNSNNRFFKATIQNIIMDIPEGFAAVENQPGFLHKGSASTIMVSEINNSPVSFTFNHLNPEQFEKDGSTLVNTEKIKTLSGSDALLYTLKFMVTNKDDIKNNIEFERLILFTGDENTTICLVANYPTLVKSLISEPIKKSLFSVVFK